MKKLYYWWRDLPLGEILGQLAEFIFVMVLLFIFMTPLEAFIHCQHCCLLCRP